MTRYISLSVAAGFGLVLLSSTGGMAQTTRQGPLCIPAVANPSIYQNCRLQVRSGAPVCRCDLVPMALRGAPTSFHDQSRSGGEFSGGGRGGGDFSGVGSTSSSSTDGSSTGGSVASGGSTGGGGFSGGGSVAAGSTGGSLAGGGGGFSGGGSVGSGGSTGTGNTGAGGSTPADKVADKPNDKPGDLPGGQTPGGPTPGKDNNGKDKDNNGKAKGHEPMTGNPGNGELVGRAGEKDGQGFAAPNDSPAGPGTRGRSDGGTSGSEGKGEGRGRN